MGCVMGGRAGAPDSSSQSLHIFLHTDNALTASCLFLRSKPRVWLEFEAKDAGPKDRCPAATKSPPMELPISHILTKCGEVAERLKAAVC